MCLVQTARNVIAYIIFFDILPSYMRTHNQSSVLLKILKLKVQNDAIEKPFNGMVPLITFTLLLHRGSFVMYKG